MKLSTGLCEAMCFQIQHELGNASKYMQIASYFENLQLTNISSYFKKQSDDEKQHANKFMNHINERIEKETRELQLLEMILKVDRAADELNNYPKDLKNGLKTLSRKRLKTLYSDMNDEEIDTLYERIHMA